LRKTKVGVIGVGHLGAHHARIYSEIDSAKLVGVSDIDKKRGAGIAEKYGVDFFPRPSDLLEKIDAVSVAVPAESHYEVSREALTMGVHTLVEKPITCTVREADSLIELEKKTGVRLFVGHTERFSSPVVALRDRITKPLFVECHRLSSFGPRGTDVDVVLDLMIHDIDIVLWLVQSHPERVDALGVPVLTEHEDIANARIEFADGCVANLTASRVSREKLRKIRIFQKDEYISIDTPGSSVEICARFSDEKGRPRIRRDLFQVDGDEPLKAELIAFLGEVGGRKKTALATGAEGREALAVALKVLEQMRERRARFDSE
jgi:predicted dehydrogenase